MLIICVMSSMLIREANQVVVILEVCFCETHHKFWPTLYRESYLPREAPSSLKKTLSLSLTHTQSQRHSSIYVLKDLWANTQSLRALLNYSSLVLVFPTKFSPEEMGNNILPHPVGRKWDPEIKRSNGQNLQGKRLSCCKWWQRGLRFLSHCD